MQKHKYLAIAISIVVGGLWIALVMYTLSLGKTKVPVNPGAAAVSSAHRPSGVNIPTASFKTSNSSSWSFIHHDAAITPAAATKPQATMGSTSMRIHETSSATVHQIGGGGMGSGQGVMATTSGANKGISYSGISYGGNLVVLSSSIAITAPGASEANELATIASAPRRAKKDGAQPPTPLNPFIDPQPLGDVAWPVMLLLTIAWCVRVHRRKQQACK